jgi:DNA-binding GntR family transcriptional regulator
VFGDITPTSLADEIAFRLQTAILEGTFPPGTHLLQDELCKQFGVSRTPVREALRKLQAQHLVVLIPNKGATVRVPSRTDLLNVYVVRAELEGLACELACPQVDDELIADLDRTQAEMQEAMGRLERGQVSGDAEPAFNRLVTRANEEFHGAIHRAAANDRLTSIILELDGFFPKDYVWRAIKSSDEMQVLQLDDHVRIRNALAERNAAEARRAMTEHINRARAALLAYLDEHGLLNSA